MFHLALLVWALALTTASAQDEVVLSGQITDSDDNPVSLLPPHLGSFSQGVDDAGTDETNH